MKLPGIAGLLGKRAQRVGSSAGLMSLISTNHAHASRAHLTANSHTLAAHKRVIMGCSP